MITAYTIDGAAYPLGDPASVLLERAMDTPADRFEATFPLSVLPPELHAIRVENNNADVFYGLVDEQTAEYAQKGGLLYLSARSLAAALLDNEAMVQDYETPTLQEIYKRHAKPHGIVGVRGSALAYNGTMTVSKGQSDWAAVAAYCRGVGGVRPHITPDRYLDVRLAVGDSAIKYSNTDVDGIRYSSVAHTLKRCDPVSDVLLKSTDGGTYQFTEQNYVVHKKGINRKRLMEIRANVGTVQRSAKEMMRESNYGYEQYHLRTAGGHLPDLGHRAQLRDECLGAVPGLVVAEVRYRRSPTGEYSDVVLIPESNL